MKPNTPLAGLIAVVFLTAGAAAVAADTPALNKRQQLQPQVQLKQIAKPVVTNPCPQGWYLASPVQSDGSFMCKPAKPRPVECPDGTQWVDNGCAVGCQTLLY